MRMTGEARRRRESKRIAVILRVKDEEEERKAKRGSKGWRERVARQ